MSKFKPKFIQLPLSKMAGCPWNILDHRGFRIAWCGTDGNHEKDGELIANDLLNLIAIGDAVDELHEQALAKQQQPNSTVPAKLDKCSAIILEDGCWLQIGRRRWLYSRMEGDSFRFIGQHVSEPEKMDEVDQVRVFSYSELEAFIQAGFLWTNRPIKMTMPQTGPTVRGKE